MAEPPARPGPAADEEREAILDAAADSDETL